MSKFELSREVAGSNLRPMEGMRGFAVFLVFLVHYASLADPAGSVWMSKVLHSMGNAGVDLFFVLSGYLIYGSLVSREQAFMPYMRRRIQRIYPAFLAVFATYCVLSLVFPNESKIPQEGALWYLLQNLLLLPGMLPIEPMITVAWSLSYEMFFYLVMPAAVFFLRPLGSQRRTGLILVAAFLTIAYCSVYGGHIRLIMFMSGMLLYEAVKRARAPHALVGALALVLGLAATVFPVPGTIETVILFATFYLFCLHCFVHPGSVLARAFTWTPMRRLGNMSYSYYLIHGLALKAAFMVLPAGQMFFLLLPLAFAWTLVPSMLLFLMVERPFSLATTKPAAVQAEKNQARLGGA
jgi:peptidoglycan/LPS O-acetylase OafA/YrhL